MFAHLARAKKKRPINDRPAVIFGSVSHMSTTLKVFIILILLMAMAFAWIQMTLYATRENWKRRWNEDTTALIDINKTLDQNLTHETYLRVKAESQVASLDAQLSDHQSKIKDLEGTITELKKDKASLELTISKNEDTIRGLQENVESLTNTLELTRQRNNELSHIASVSRAVTHQLNVKLAEVEDDLHSTTTALAAKEEDFNNLTKENNSNKAKLAKIREDFPKAWQIANDPAASDKFLQAIVAAVTVNPQGQQDLVMLTIGDEEGVQEGMEFIVFRDNQYIVKVRAERIMNDMVACRVIPDTWNTNGAEIQLNDHAQNRL
jgi:TolA-binding protein